MLSLMCVDTHRRWKENRKRIFVYPKNRHEYYVAGVIKMKNQDGTWSDAIVYRDNKDNSIYARNREDFYNKFVQIDEYKNGKV